MKTDREGGKKRTEGKETEIEKKKCKDKNRKKQK